MQKHSDRPDKRSNLPGSGQPAGQGASAGGGQSGQNNAAAAAAAAAAAGLTRYVRLQYIITNFNFSISKFFCTPYFSYTINLNRKINLSLSSIVCIFLIRRK